MQKLNSLFHFPNRASNLVLIAIICLFQFVSHAYYLKIPASGHHVWRQCNTLAVARNYAEVDMNILYPRIDKNYGTDGITGPQFTSYDYTLAWLYRIFGFSQFTHRWLSLIISFSIIAGLFHLSNQFFNSKIISFWSTFSVLGIPEFYYHSFNAVPDILAMAAMIWAWYFYNKLNQSNSWNHAWFGAVLLALAGMTKLMFLIPGFVFLGDIWNRGAFPRQKNAEQYGKLWPKWGIIAFISLIFSYAWYRWAHYLTYLHWLNEFVHEIRFFDNGSQAFQALFQNLSIDLFETWVGYPLIFLVFGGWYFVFKNKQIIKDKRILLLILASILYYIVMQKQLQIHGYYILLFVPFIVLNIGYLLNQLLNLDSVTAPNKIENVYTMDVNNTNKSLISSNSNENISNVVICDAQDGATFHYKNGSTSHNKNGGTYQYKNGSTSHNNGTKINRSTNNFPNKLNWLTVSCLLIMISPLWSWVRMHHNWTEKGFRVPNTLMDVKNATLIEKYTSENPLWIVGPDQSGCVYFYYLHAKGFPWYNLEEKDSVFDEYLNQGAQGFITDQPEIVKEMSLKFNWKIRYTKQLGTFYWIGIEK